MTGLMVLGEQARQAAAELAQTAPQAKNRALTVMAAAIRKASTEIIAANARDVTAATAKGVTRAMIDRLTLNEARIASMAEGLEAIAALPDPVGRELAKWARPNGMDITRISVPIGVIAIIYEARPNVTADAGGLCIKSGNAAILRGGSDSFASSSAIVACLREGLEQAGLNPNAIQMVPTANRDAVGELLAGLGGNVDLIVPRGGKSLVARVQAEARVPVFSHLEGINHVYVDRDADIDMATSVVLNAKMRRTGICGAAETVLIDRTIAGQALPPILRSLSSAGCEIRGDAEVAAFSNTVVPVTEQDWSTEYLDAIVSIKLVDDTADAIRHIAKYGSKHTEAIVTSNNATAEHFLKTVDSAIVLHNASTQFADGGEFGFGAEIGIATGKLHARGPVGVDQLTTFKYQVRGTGQIRPV
jgi:glutamate-5-semialdehyde dehydrogenase